MGRGQDLYRKAKKIIPGGSQLFSKKSERFLPDLWPAYFSRAKGCEIWDLDGKKYIDMSHMGVGACILGYADRDVDSFVKTAINKGTMSTLNCPEEVELARLLCKIHPWATMARFARTGGEAMAMAVRIARARMGKDLILFCGYHGWHDWYLSANLSNNKSLDGHLLQGLEPKGVPRVLHGTAIPFNYNDTEGFLKLAKKYNNKIAAVVMEPIRNHYPAKNFLETIRAITQKINTILIFDEITSGWRLALGGAHLNLSINPDIAVFAKGMSNGYPMAAVIGKSHIMQYAQDTFISSTYWTERIGPVAALVTIKKMKDRNVYRYLNKIGREIKEGWERLAKKNNLNLEVSGIEPLCHFSFGYKNPLILKTLFTQLMLEKGFLATTGFYASYAHRERYIKEYLEAVDEAFYFISKAIAKGRPEKYLKGPVCQGDFKRMT